MNDIDRIKEMKKKRFQFLWLVYKKTGGYRRNSVRINEISKSLGFDEQSMRAILQYLRDEGLIDQNPGYLAITHKGIKEVEEALENPDQPTEHFLPINIIQVDTMIGSQIQQGSPGATQVVTINEVEKKELEEIIQSLKESGDQLNLKEQEKIDFQANIETIEAQMSSPKPRKPIIIETLKAILASAAGTLLASGLTKQISAWIGG